METITKVSVLILAMLVPLAAHAADVPTVADGLRGAATLSDEKCPTLTKQLEDARKSGQAGLVFGLETGFHSLCECLPAKLAAWRAKLSPTDLQAPLVASDFQKSYRARVIVPCAGAQFRQIYSVGCTERLAKFRSNSGRYCQCMSAKIAPQTDSQLAALGAAYGLQTQRETDAKRQGQPAPEPLPALKEFIATERACSALK